MSQLVKWIYLIIAFLVGTLILIKSFDYLQPDFSKGFLIGKVTYFSSYYQFALYAHIFTAPIALFSGVYQFLKTKSKWHKLFGKLYIFSVLFFASPSAFVMALHALGGLAAVINFSLMAIIWFFFTWKAFTLIRKGQIARHQQFMIRSFILTNSAILIRVFSFINNQYLHYPLKPTYVIISWLSWLPFLLVFEIYQMLRPPIKVKPKFW